jgi:hypothetical protein
MNRILLSLIATGSLLVAAGPTCTADSHSPATGPALSREALRAARQEILQKTARLNQPSAQLDVIIGYAYMLDVSEELRQAARGMVFSFNPRLFVERTARVFDRLTAESQLAVLDVYDKNFPNMLGFSYELNNMIKKAVAAPDLAVRLRADEIAGRYKVRQAYFPLRRRANRSSGEDRLHAIETLGEIGDPRAGYFLPLLLDVDDTPVLEATYTALGQIGRAGTLTLKERMSHEDPRHRFLALRALLPIAVVDDLTALYSFVEANPSLDEELKDELYTLIARLEVLRDQGVETPSN